MYAQIFPVIAPIFACAAIGYIWAKLQLPFEKEFLTRLVLNVGVPALVIGTFSKVAMPTERLLQILGAALAIVSVTLLAGWLICRIWRLPVASYLAPLAFPNTMNMGLSVCLYSFGEEGLAIGLGIYLVVSLVHFSLGVALISGRYTLGHAVRSPVILSGVAGAALVAGGVSLPPWLQNSLDLIGSFVIPIMLITLGVSLAQLRLGDVHRSIGLGVTRIALGFGVGLLVAEALSLQGAMRGVVIIQSTMPAAVFNYILAFQYQRSPQAVAGIVIVSTLLSFVSLPVLLWFLGVGA